MILSVLNRRTRPGSHLLRRRFHSTPRSSIDNPFKEAVGTIVDNSIAFHDLFHHVHNLTGLSLIASIPLATILVRSLVTPFRYYLARRRQEQREVAQKLELEALIISKQAENRLALKRTTVEEIKQWKRNQWNLRKFATVKHHPLSEPTLWMSPDSKFDITNIYAMALVTINTSSLLAMTRMDPSQLALPILEGMEPPLLLCFFVLAMLNTNYFRPTRPLFKFMEKLQQGHRFQRWASTDTKGMFVLLLQTYAACFLIECPVAVIFSAVSNSAYTMLETRSIEALTTKTGGMKPMTKAIKSLPTRVNSV